jgi:hypothetical protein
LQQLTDVDPASPGPGAQIMKQRQLFAGMHQKRRQLLGVGTVMAELNQSDCPIAPTVQVGSEVAQDSIGVLIVFIDEGGKITLRVEHEVPSSWTFIGREGRAAKRSSSCRAFRAVLLAKQNRFRTEIRADHRGGKPRWSLLFD